MSNKVRCKFKVDSITNYQYGNEAKLSAVVSNDPEHENSKFFGATPAGQLTVMVSNESIDSMKPGQEYYLDLTPAN
ncbi:TPA: hypothetical protein NGR89_004456 [Vibrio parahaemolyticus]|nr:hypothetical protein [Vibrio parahaemolyticus]